MSLIRILVVTTVMFLGIGSSAVEAASTPEGTCQVGRYKAAAKFAACHQKFFAKIFGGGIFGEKEQKKLSKCRDKYRATWAKLQAKASGTGATCDTARFVDNGNGTVTDYLTGLQWEKKTNLDGTSNGADRHDGDNKYTWSATSTAGDGTAYTDFLATLNGGGCFAGQCDWRLPTVAELQTILRDPYPCATGPCIDAIFGPAAVLDTHWSSTTRANDPLEAWTVHFFGGQVQLGNDKTESEYTRAVRGGL